MNDLKEEMQAKVISNLLERVGALEAQDKGYQVDVNNLTIGQAIDLLREKKAEQISCYAEAHCFMYLDDETNELRTRALNGMDYPWVVKARELGARFRVLK